MQSPLTDRVINRHVCALTGKYPNRKNPHILGSSSHTTSNTILSDPFTRNMSPKFQHRIINNFREIKIEQTQKNHKKWKIAAPPDKQIKVLGSKEVIL